MLRDAWSQWKKPVNGVPSKYPVFEAPCPKVWLHLESGCDLSAQIYVQGLFDTMFGIPLREASDCDSCF